MENLSCILEGCDHDSPRKLQYSGLNLYVPDNSALLLIGSTKMLLSGKFDEYHPETLKRIEIPKLPSKGWKLVDANSGNPGWVNWVFEMPHSIVLRDRVYINETLFKPGWQYYDKVLPKVLQDSIDILTGKKSEMEINSLGRAAF